MGNWKRPKADRLLAAHLRGELENGRWQGRMPGVIRLAGELGVARNTVEAALRVLEAEGVLQSRGPGRGRVVGPNGPVAGKGSLRLGILTYEAGDRFEPHLLEVLARLERAGCAVVFAPKSVLDLKREVERVSLMVTEMKVDAWVVIAGSTELLAWFARQSIPVFALFGRSGALPMAGGGPDKAPAIRTAVRRLHALGHRRVILLVRNERRKPNPGPKEQVFLEEVGTFGSTTGPYHLPDWGESPEGLAKAIDGLYEITPPTALIVDEVPMFIAAQAHLSRRGLQVPRDVSLVCCDMPGAAMEWVWPGISHIAWNHRPLVERIAQWVENLKLGRADLRQTSIPARFVEGGTIGPAPPPRVSRREETF